MTPLAGSPLVPVCLARLTHSRAAPPHRRSRHPGPLPSDSADTATAETAPAPSPQRRRERSNFRLCSEWMTSAHIGNSTVPGSRCDLPVAHLLASVKCKSLRASVSAQYSQEHEGSCAEGRVRVGRQQGALFPPLSGVYGLKKKICLFARFCRECQLTAAALNPASASSWGLAWGTTPAGSSLSAEAAAPTLWLHRTWRWRGRDLGM